ncbi:MAG: hypothetical protein IJO03_08075 [Clostridia bacterium]|nr:hypothetical protein [Clostridia bacterium]
MKHIKISFCILLCVFMLASCGKTDNTDYFASALQGSDEETRYMPLIFKSMDAPEDVRISSLADGTTTFTVEKSITAESGNVYHYANIHIQKHNSDINGSIDETIDSYVEEAESIVNAVKHEYGGKKYAVSYEIRPDLDCTVLNVIYPVTDNISAFFALRLSETPDSMTDELLDTICKDTEVMKI